MESGANWKKCARARPPERGCVCVNKKVDWSRANKRGGCGGYDEDEAPAPPPPVSTTATTSASGTTNDAVSTTQCTTVMNVAGTGSSLLRDALMLPKSPLPRAIISLNNNVKGTTTFLHHNYASLPLLRDEHRESTSASKVGTYLHIVVPKVRPPKY